MDDWSFRTEIKNNSHKWPLIITICLLGCLAGWVVSFYWTSYYQATNEIYVGLNIYNAMEDRNVSNFADGIKFDNVNDYKNWQMANLDVFVFMDDVVEKTINLLRERDSYWVTISGEELRTHLRVDWQNVGKWSLVAEFPSSNRASQAISAWSDVILEELEKAISSSREVMLLDKQLQSTVGEIANNKSRIAELEYTRELMNNFVETTSDNHNSFEKLDYWRLWSVVAHAAKYDPAWISGIKEFPLYSSPSEELIDWIDRVNVLIDNEVKILQNQNELLEIDRINVTEQYATSSEDSLGFSANLEVEKVSNSKPQITPVRPTSQLALIGGILGLLVWGIAWIARPFLMAKR